MTHQKKPTLSVVTYLIILAVFSLGIPGRSLVAAKPSEILQPDLSLSAQEQNQGELSTPDLIEQAFANGEITAEQRILYLTYAIYDFKSLPSRFYSNVEWEGTSYIQEINAVQNAVASGKAPLFSTEAQAEFSRLSALASTVCALEDGDSSLESDNFYLSYSSIGGGLTAQDYLDTLENTFFIEVTSYGWPKPPYCVNGIGTCTSDNPWGKYPVQVAILAPGYLGAVVRPPGDCGSYCGDVGDNPNTTAIETHALATCMIVNQDYSLFGNARDAMERNISHEFLHAIQRGVGDPALEEDLMWYESSARYIQDEVYDNNNQLYSELWPQFTSCLGQYPDGSPFHYEYSNWLFLRYAAEHNGGTNTAGGGEDILQAFWTNVAAGQSGLTAYNNALGTKGTNLDDTFHNYAIAARFSKSCPTGTPYCFEEGSGYVAAAGVPSSHGSISAIGGSYPGNLQDNYAINWIDLPTTGTYSVTLDNTTSTLGQFRVSIVADTGSGLQVTPFPSVVTGNNSVTLAKYQPPAGATSVVAVITNQTHPADEPTACALNPYKLSLADPITIAFVIDDTGSMLNSIGVVKTFVTLKVDNFVTQSIFPDYHLITYKDNVTDHGSTTNTTTIKNWVNALSASGGGDCPEEMLGALNRTAQVAPQSEAWVLTDAGYHGGIGDVITTIGNLIAAGVRVHIVSYGWCSDSSSAAAMSLAPDGQDGGTQNDDSHEPKNKAEALTGTAALTSVGRDSLARLATETGGHYFSIGLSETEAVTNILMNEMVTSADLSIIKDQVTSGSPKTYNVQIDGTTEAANFLLNNLSGSTDLVLHRPGGALVNPGDPDVTVTEIIAAQYVQIDAPAAGVWQAQVTGNGEYTLSTSGNSPIGFEYLSDTSLSKDEQANLQVSLTGPVDSVTFTLTHNDGTSPETVALFDDGLHGDNGADDGIYGGVWTPTTTGNFFMHAQGTTEDADAFERVITKVIRVDVPPTVLSSVRASVNPTSDYNVAYTVTFSEPVIGVDINDFVLTTGGVSGAAISSVSGSDSVYTVTVNTGSGSGTIRLDVVDNDTIMDSHGTPLSGAGLGNGNFTSGESYNVDTTANDLIVSKLDDTSDGLCNADCSLREAIASAVPGASITFDSGLSGGTIHLASTLILSRNVTIDGSALAMPITISGDTDNNGTGNVPVFVVNSAVTATMNSLTITKGKSNDLFSGGGGANKGTLTIMNSTFSENEATYGAGLYNSGILTIKNSTFLNNHALHGGVYILQGAVTITNSTFSNNTANNGTGGGVSNTYGTLTITNSTFSGNSAAHGGGLYNQAGTLRYANTILANSSSGGDCVNTGTLGTNINNLVEDGSCSALLSGDPNLGPLANNGGLTQTMGLLSGSLAIDAGDTMTCINALVDSLDQRGIARPQGAQCDIGAYEFVDSSTPTATPTQTNTPTPTATATETPTPTITPTPTATTSPNGANLALNKPATASGSCAGTTPDQAVNGEWIGGFSTKWCDAGSASKWWQVDLGAVYNLSQFVIYHTGAGGADDDLATYNTRDFNIQVSMDNLDWTTVATVAGNTADITTHNTTPTNARYVRLNITAGEQDGSTARIYEVLVYDPSAPVFHTVFGNAGAAGATLSYNDSGPKTATAGSDGRYSFVVPHNWSGTVTPSMAGYIFTPASMTYTDLVSDQTAQNYTAALFHTISGNAGVAGATLSYNDGGAKTATTDSIGNYSFTVSYNWSGTVTPSKAGYTFSPANRTYTNLTADQSNQYYYPVVSQYLISGNAGVAGATLNYYIDGVTKAATSDASGNYGFTVPYNWSGTVTPSKTGVAFTPASLSYYNVTASQSAQNYAGILTYISAATHDGWVLESAEASGVGGTMNNTANVFQLGDDAANRQYRSILSFNTGSLPNTAVIQSVVLKIKQNGTPVGTNPFTALGSLRVDIRQGAFGTGNALELADFNAAASALAVGTFNETPVGGWYSATLNATGRSYINDAGYTQLRLRFSTDDNNNLAADFMRFLSGDYTSGQPELIITYTLP